MPNRIIRDGILTSEKVDRLGPVAEVFYRRLMSVVDDYGRYTAHPSLLRAACYPLRVDKVREADISRLLAEVQDAGLIVLYAVNTKRYLQIVEFRQQMRTPSKFPPPDEGLISNDINCAQLISNAHVDEGAFVFGVVVEDVGVKDSSEPSKRRSKQESTGPPADGFLEFPIVGNRNNPSWWLTNAKVAEYRENYPGVDVVLECRRALQWCRDNESKRKTAAGMAKFLNSWMTKAQNDGRTNINRSGGQAGREQTGLTASLDALSRYAAQDDQGGIQQGDGSPVRLEANGGVL